MSDDLDALLDAALEKRTTALNSETVEVLVGGEPWFLKFVELDGQSWADVIAVNPMRAGAPIDRQFGYNYDGAAMSAAPLSGVRVVEGTEQKLTPEQWEKLFKVLAGHDFTKITNAIWALNEVNPMRRLAAAKKALAPAPAKKRTSPAK